MDKQLIKVISKLVEDKVRAVIKEELTEILREGLQPTINEMRKETISENVNQQEKSQSVTKTAKRNPKLNFKKNGFADILNETDALREQGPLVMNSGADYNVPSYADLMTEDITMTSADAMNFGAQRKSMANMPMQPNMAAPTTMTDPETGKNMQVPNAVANVLNRDYSALMKAIDKKKGR
jgi:methionyl-tRNA formyltransferase